jgi:hypothetical protein
MRRSSLKAGIIIERYMGKPVLACSVGMVIG